MKKPDFAIIYVILGFIMIMSLYYVKDKYLQGFVFAIAFGFFLVAGIYSYKGEKQSEKSVQ